jgi:hypothetical protein
VSPREYRSAWNLLRAERQLLRLDDTKDLAPDAQGVVGRAVFRRIFFDRASVVTGERAIGHEARNAPALYPIFSLLEAPFSDAGRLASHSFVTMVT